MQKLESVQLLAEKIAKQEYNLRHHITEMMGPFLSRLNFQPESVSCMPMTMIQDC